MKLFFIILLLITFNIVNVKAETKVVTLEKCVDGDTAYFNLDGESKKFRFLAIDTPESVHPTKKAENFGKDASNYTCDLLTNASEIIVEYDSNSDKLDKYDRHLAWIWVDKELLQKKLVENGYAKVAYIYGDYKYTKNLCAIEKEAKDSLLNIWSQEDYEDGYCKNIDVTGVSKEISMDIDQNNKVVIYYALGIGVVILSLLTGKKINVKKLKKKLS